MRLATIPFIAAMALGVGTSAHAQDGGTISEFCKNVLSQFEQQIAENGLVVTEVVEGGTVRAARGEYLDFLRLQVSGRADSCLRFVVKDDPVQSPSKPVSGG